MRLLPLFQIFENMKNYVCILLLGLFALGLSAQTPERYARVEISLVGKNIADLARLGIETDHGHHLPGRSLTTEISESELQTVQNQGFEVKILVEDLQKQYLELRQYPQPAASQRNVDCAGAATPVYPTPANYTYGSMGGYHTLEEMLAVLDDMANKFPGLITQRAPVSDSILTWEGRPIWYVKISANANVDEDEPEVLYTALHHSREPNALSQMLFYMWYLLENYATDPAIQYVLNNEELYFVPCVNPDGYVFNQTTNPEGGGFWRKNRRDNGDGTFGVDLNRNYSYFWGNDDEGSSPNTSAATYRGPAPFSEPESRTMRDFALAHDFIFAHNYHTFSNLLIYPWAYSDTPADPALVEYAKLFTRENRYKYGTAIETVGYRVNGDSNDWIHAEKGTLAFTPEVGATGFWPQPGEIEGLNQENYWQNFSTALSALRFAEARDESPASLPQLNGQLEISVKRYGFEDGPFIVYLVPVSDNIASSTVAQAFDLQQLQSVSSYFNYQLSPDIEDGETVVFLLALDNGAYTHTDTLRKVYAAGVLPTVAFEDNLSTLNNWSGSPEWGLTTESFVSAPTSITDSPNGGYNPGANTLLGLAESIALPADATNPVLRFSARWDIEADYDYVQIIGYGSEGTVGPLCGRYTVEGQNAQPIGEPVYEGQQSDWVEEEISLAAYLGQDFTLEFRLIADDFLELDGFYFDDLRVEYNQAISSVPVIVSLEKFRLQQNQPNPASGITTIGWDNLGKLSGDANLMIFNALGEKIFERSVHLQSENQVKIDTRTWPQGVYAYTLRTAQGQTQPLKMTVLR
jgi:carboxypeptidase T